MAAGFDPVGWKFDDPGGCAADICMSLNAQVHGTIHFALAELNKEGVVLFEIKADEDWWPMDMETRLIQFEAHAHHNNNQRTFRPHEQVKGYAWKTKANVMIRNLLSDTVVEGT